MNGHTLFDKLWDAHVVRDLGDGWALLHIDRHLLHDLSGPVMLGELSRRGCAVANPELAFATPDHAISTVPGRTGQTYAAGAHLWRTLTEECAARRIRLFDVDQSGQGIVHVMAPELGLVLPGLTVICGDSHTCTNGGLGALAFGVGTSEGAHALATQTVRQRKPPQMRVRYSGALAPGVTAKDLALHTIRQLGASAGAGYCVEFAGPVIDAMDIEGRLTLCNLSVELGARYGLIAPDEATIAYLRGRPYAPRGAAFEAALPSWRTLRTDADAAFDCNVEIDASQVVPTITWGTSPEQAIPVDGRVPEPGAVPAGERPALEDALRYMGLQPGQRIAGTPVDWVFIGSCANSRLSDLRAAAQVARGRHVPDSVTAWVVPGSLEVKRAAEAEGLDRIFVEAGFQWREPGCSMCVAANGEQVPPGQRCVSTSNRNFVGRQGPGARTHLASPAMAAAAAVSGCISDLRSLA
ncbi:3-isopropylmalate dehydratase large subunit [Ramlibacter rhizophilus]|uniref:3-isopropylmalate dehydratase n=1 Tax=Ramlibacter rhizophilus TaxID=1781167 RepID=A0A4Z0C1R2_9BURK|nr:3-isopropylmalate dehydratase large subunit [Ramlibacter rhizophilus]TFZ04448.1 3-isopropylmalate dehydratase large subunit [Ramlibacter rhizophilus]